MAKNSKIWSFFITDSSISIVTLQAPCFVIDLLLPEVTAAGAFERETAIGGLRSKEIPFSLQLDILRG